MGSQWEEKGVVGIVKEGVRAIKSPILGIFL